MEQFTARPELCGTFGAVASTHWIASAVGMKLLEAGGNAFDAAVAAGFVLQIVEPHLNGPAGDAPIIASRFDDPQPTVICGQGGAPAAATIECFQALDLDLVPGTGLLAACVPGAFGAWLSLLKKWGTVSLREALDPAIQYARHGHPILGRVVETISSVKELFLNEWPSSAEVFLQDGNPPTPGSLFANPRLADLYQTIVEFSEAAGGDRAAQIDAALEYWYEGPVAQTIDRFCRDTKALDTSGRKHRGLLRESDLHGWRAAWEIPVSVEYRGHTVFKCGAWSQGPSLLQALKILERHDMAALAPDSPEFVHLITETLKLVMADRDAWYGDTPSVPLDILLSDAYADQRTKLIGAVASHDLRPGSISGQMPIMAVSLDTTQRRSSAPGGGEPTFSHEKNETVPLEYEVQRGDTCHVDIVDRWGNMVSATPSGGWLQSSPLIPDLGFALGTRLQMSSLRAGHPAALAPGKRPRTTLTPTMVFKAGQPYMACGTPGGDQQEQWTLLLLTHHIDKGMPLQQAIEMPAFHTDHLIASFWPREVSIASLVVEGRFPQDTVTELTRRGHALKVGGPWSEGRLSACTRDLEAGMPMLRAGANPRGMQGYAITR